VEVNKLPAKHLQTFSQLFGLALDFPLGLWILRGFVAEVNVHARPTIAPVLADIQ
jgi:hypothetical protein